MYDPTRGRYRAAVSIWFGPAAVLTLVALVTFIGVSRRRERTAARSHRSRERGDQRNRTSPLFPESASTVAGEVDRSTLPGRRDLGLLLAAHRRPGDRDLSAATGAATRARSAHREHAPEWLEIAWTVVPLAIVARSCSCWGTKVFFTLSRPPAEATEFLAIGRQWMWKFQHPQGPREINDCMSRSARPSSSR